jgi:hypothetical protein
MLMCCYILCYAVLVRRFAVFHKRTDERLRSFPAQSAGHVTRLFLLDVPTEIRAEFISELLRKAGRDPALMDISVNHISIASEDEWPPDVKLAWGSTAVETITWDALQEEAKGWRRITIRVTPEVYAMVQSEAKRRHQSLTQFCIDSVETQVGTRSHRIELEIFSFFYGGGYSGQKRSTSLPDLRQCVARSFADCTFHEIEDALKRLHPTYIRLDKWKDSLPHGQFYPYDGDDNEFFYRGEFRLEITADGRPYFEALSKQLSPTTLVDGFLNVVRAEPGAETRLGQFAAFFTPVDSRGGAMRPHYCNDGDDLRRFLMTLGLSERVVAGIVNQAQGRGSSNERLSLPQSKVNLIS